jgi:hypothetical protein
MQGLVRLRVRRARQSDDIAFLTEGDAFAEVEGQLALGSLDDDDLAVHIDLDPRRDLNGRFAYS